MTDPLTSLEDLERFSDFFFSTHKGSTPDRLSLLSDIETLQQKLDTLTSDISSLPNETPNPGQSPPPTHG